MKTISIIKENSIREINRAVYNIISKPRSTI